MIILPTAAGASRLFNALVAIDPRASDTALLLLEGAEARGGLKAFADDFDNGRSDDEAGLYSNVEGVAIIRVHGVLLQRVGSLWWLYEMFGITGYDRLRMAIIRALDDKSVRAIALDVDSPGGEVAGCFDLVDTLYRARGEKPIWAILGENAYSAAYAIASAADVITVPRTGGTGSVGVIYMHVSFEEALNKAGIEVTLITKGDLKGEGSEFKNLTDEALARMRADVEAVGDLFDATVARNRGMAQKNVFATQAGTYLGEAGVEIGFADAVMAPDEAFRSLLAELG